jgi:beta-N-acetylhexosaminidase
LSVKKADDKNLRQRAGEIAAGMSDNDLCAQLIMGGIDSFGTLQTWEAKRLQEIPCGGIMLFTKNLKTDEQGIKNLNMQILKVYSGIKPFIAVDQEGGSVERLKGDLSALHAPYSYYEYARSMSKNAALDMLKSDAALQADIFRRLGINMNFAPVGEVFNDRNKLFLKDRSYGQDSDFVSLACNTFITSMQDKDVACVLKHFPGNTDDDPHFTQSVLQNSDASINQQTESFKRIIAETNVSAVMVSHVIVQAWDNKNNASLSSIVINEYLRKQFNFSGIIIADDFSMGAVASSYSFEDACVKAVNAGIDMLMAWPANLQTVHKTLLRALKNKTIERARLEDAAAHIIYEKLSLSALPKL